MIVRLALLVLIVVLVLAVVGKWRRLPRRGSRPAVEAARKCPVCGTYVLAGEPVPCERCRDGSAGA
jgi:hypothetical protein